MSEKLTGVRSPGPLARLATAVAGWSVGERFLAGFLAGLLPAIAWVAFYFYSLGTGPDAVRWFWGNATFSIHHPLLMPVCFAVFAATAKFALFGWLPNSSWYVKAARVGVPAALVLVVIGFALADSGAHPRAPYMVADPTERDEVFKLEKELRKEAKARPDKVAQEGTPQFKRYQVLTRATEGGAGPRSALEWSNTALTIYYSLFVGVMYWYLFLLLWGAALDRLAAPAGGPPTPPPYEVGLIFAYAVWLLWFPLRIYANWFEHGFINKEWLTEHAAVTMMTVLALVGLIVLFALSFLERLPMLAGAVAGVAGVVGAVAGGLRPDWLEEAARFFHHLALFHYLFLALVVLPSLGTLGLYVATTRP